MNRIITGYGPTAKCLHWLIVALLMLQYVVAWSIEIDGGDRPVSNPLHNLHISLGVTIFGLALLRLIWRQTHPVPDYLELPHWQHYAARITHALLYLLIVVMPVAGMIAASGETAPLELYGILRLQLPVLPETLIEFSEEAHEVLGIILLVVIAVHVAAALYHFAIKGDAVMQRMLPSRFHRS
jgi:cytochrome b561